MSKYHANCTKDPPEQANRDRAGTQLTSKVRTFLPTFFNFLLRRYIPKYLLIYHQLILFILYCFTFQPFCDCTMCIICKNCPDILKLLCISVTENSCDFGSKVTKATKKGTCPLHDLGQHQSFLDVVNKNRDCTCEVVAHAVRSQVHMNIGMSERRTATNDYEKSTTSQDIEPEK